jgi:hypothetical protein
MPRLTSPRLALVLLCVCALAVLVEATLLYPAWRGARRAAAEWRQRQAELNRLAQHAPALTPENVSALAEEVRVAELCRDAWRDALEVPAAVVAAPATSTDAFFDLAAFVREMDRQARAAAIEVRADEAFGFASHARTGPEGALIPIVHRQRVLAQHVLATLFAAQPRRLLGVQRDRPAGDGSAGTTDDFFRLERARQSRRPDVGGVAMLRVAFVGRTSTLRAFLNGLASSAIPIGVLSVEAEPLPSDDRSESHERAVTGPGLSPTDSKFTVVVEWLEVRRSGALASS